MKPVLALTALALACGSALAFAASHDGQDSRQGHRSAAIERLRAADTNGDGQLSREEAAVLPRLAQRFDAIDADRDGHLSRPELRAAHGKRHGAGMFRVLDADKDGKVSKAEALAAAERRFDRADADGDGFITPEELRAGHRRRHGEPK